MRSMPIRETRRVRGVAVPSIMYGTDWKEERTQALTSEAIACGFRAINGEPAQTLRRSGGWGRGWSRRRLGQRHARAALPADEIHLAARPGSSAAVRSQRGSR